MGSAACTPSKMPIFCDGNTEALQQPSYSSAPNPTQWQTLTKDNQSYYTLVNIGNNNTTVDNLLLYAGTGTPAITYKNSKYEIGGLNGLTLKSDKGIIVKDGTGQLGISIWSNETNTIETFTLDLSTIAATSYAVYGNMYVEGNHDNNTQNTFTGKFGGKGIKGNVTLSAKGNTILEFSTGATIEGSTAINNASGTITFKNLTSVTNGINLQGGNRTINFQDSNGSTTLVPTLTANINLTGGTTTINELSTLQGNITTTNVQSGGTINFSSDTTIAGNITTSQTGGLDSIAIITATNNLTFGDGTSEYTIQSKAQGFAQTKNLIKVSGKTTFNKTAIVSINNTGYPNYGNKINIISTSSAEGTINEVTSAIDATRLSYGDASRVYNVLSLEGNDSATTTNLTIEAINKQTTLNSNGGATGNNYIGKSLTSGENSNLALAFDNTTWSNSSHQANVNLTVSNDIYTNAGANYINVKSLTANTITANRGSNNIVAGNGTNSISGTITANGGNNNITLGGSSNTVSAISATRGRNTITFSNSSATTNKITGNISAAVPSGNQNPFNVIISQSGLALGNGSDISISAKDVSFYASARNFIDLRGDLTLGSNLSISATQTTSDYTTSGVKNIIKIGGNIANDNSYKVTELSTSIANGASDSKTFNILSIDGSSDSTLTITKINQSGTSTGYNYIGKSITQN